MYRHRVNEDAANAATEIATRLASDALPLHLPRGLLAARPGVGQWRPGLDSWPRSLRTRCRYAERQPGPALELGDSPPTPGGPADVVGVPDVAGDLSAAWTDPYRPPAAGPKQGLGLQPFPPRFRPTPSGDTGFLPPVVTQPFDRRGRGIYVRHPAANPNQRIWEDDLIMTGVRSFDVKAYDNSFAGYVDLGWGDDPRIATATQAITTRTSSPTRRYSEPFSTGRRSACRYNGNPDNNGIAYTQIQTYPIHPLVTYAHEGRIPPSTLDVRPDPQLSPINGSMSTSATTTASVIRLRRVWDSWSTDYTRAPATASTHHEGSRSGCAFGEGRSTRRTRRRTRCRCGGSRSRSGWSTPGMNTSRC